MNLMSKSCFSPGIVNFISNLISSTDSDDLDTGKKWLDEYSEGMGHEIYRIKLSEKMKNKTFGEIASIVYKYNHSIIFAIEIKTNEKTIIRLNPSNFVVSNIEANDIRVYVISQDKKQAVEIETLQMTEEEINRYNAQEEGGKLQDDDEDEPAEA